MQPGAGAATTQFRSSEAPWGGGCVLARCHVDTVLKRCLLAARPPQVPTDQLRADIEAILSAMSQDELASLTSKPVVKALGERLNLGVVVSRCWQPLLSASHARAPSLQRQSMASASSLGRRRWQTWRGYGAAPSGRRQARGAVPPRTLCPPRPPRVRTCSTQCQAWMQSPRSSIRMSPCPTQRLSPLRTQQWMRLLLSRAPMQPTWARRPQAQRTTAMRRQRLTLLWWARKQHQLRSEPAPPKGAGNLLARLDQSPPNPLPAPPTPALLANNSCVRVCGRVALTATAAVQGDLAPPSALRAGGRGGARAPRCALNAAALVGDWEQGTRSLEV